MKILIGGAWPYANGSLHIGHVASLLPGDVIARYHRAKGNSVYYVSGSDCYGTPVSIRAKQENKSQREISDHYHGEFCRCFEKLGFSYDKYGKTSSDEHRDFVRDFHREMYKGDYVYEKEAPQAYCEACGQTLTDRFVVGSCPVCGEKARGDQCDGCGTVLEPENLIKPVCSLCGQGVTFRKTRHLFIAISQLESRLTAYLNTHLNWRKNAVAFTKRYIDEGLRDRAITRDVDWGVDVPAVGYEEKKIYIWAENVLGYLSMSKAAAETRGENYEDLWGDDSRHYYVHGKDNIPFHTIILPSLMLANGGDWKPPDDIISSEYLTLEGRKISTSQNWAVWVKDMMNRYHPDSIRYFMIAKGPERRDSDFSWREFVNSHNGELLGAYGNFVHRVLAFIYNYVDAAVPEGLWDSEIETRVAALYLNVGTLIENGVLKEAIDTIFDFARFGNKYFDTEQPWRTRQTDIAACHNTLFNCVQIIANLAVLLEPFLPFSSGKVKGWFGLDSGWSVRRISAGFVVPQPDLLFERIDKAVVDAELQRLRR
jgi:methionyl-tRNA synthetase